MVISSLSNLQGAFSGGAIIKEEISSGTIEAMPSSFLMARFGILFYGSVGICCRYIRIDQVALNFAGDGAGVFISSFGVGASCAGAPDLNFRPVNDHWDDDAGLSMSGVVAIIAGPWWAGRRLGCRFYSLLANRLALTDCTAVRFGNGAPVFQFPITEVKTVLSFTKSTVSKVRFFSRNSVSRLLSGDFWVPLHSATIRHSKLNPPAGGATLGRSGCWRDWVRNNEVSFRIVYVRAPWLISVIGVSSWWLAPGTLADPFGIECRFTTANGNLPVIV